MRQITVIYIFRNFEQFKVKKMKLKSVIALKSLRNPVPLGKRLKEATLDLLFISTAQALLKVFKSKRIFHKVSWLVFLIVSTGLCAWFSLNCVASYFNHAYFTIVETYYEQPTQFPTVTFSAGIRSRPLGNLSSMIVECWFNYDKSCYDHPERYFESFFSTNLGLSYRFNGGKNMSNHSVDFLNSTIGGRDDSFRLKLKNTAGITLWIHNYSLPPSFEYYNNHGKLKIIIYFIKISAMLKRKPTFN